MANVVGFNYESLKPKDREAVRENAAAIHGLLRKTTSAVIEIGRLLADVHYRLAPADYRAWLLAEFQWSEPTGRRYEQLATRFGDLDSELVDRFRHTALWTLSRERVPAKAVSAAMAEARAGKTITCRRVQQIIAQNETPADRRRRRYRDPTAVCRIRSAMNTVRADLPLITQQMTAEQLEQLAADLLQLVEELRAKRVNGHAERRELAAAG